MLAASFWLLALMSCAFAAAFGGRDGRCFAGISAVAILLTIGAQLAGSWRQTHYWLMAVDLLVFIALFWLMLRSASYWPIWTAACQLLTVLTHVVTLMLEKFSDRIYEGLSTVWIIPLMLFAIIGVELDRKKKYDRAYASGSRPA